MWISICLIFVHNFAVRKENILSFLNVEISIAAKSFFMESYDPFFIAKKGKKKKGTHKL